MRRIALLGLCALVGCGGDAGPPERAAGTGPGAVAPPAPPPAAPAPPDSAPAATAPARTVPPAGQGPRRRAREDRAQRRRARRSGRRREPGALDDGMRDGRRGRAPEKPERRRDPAGPEGEQLVEEAREAIRDIVDRTRAGDPAICTERFTLNHVQNSTGLRGDAALEKCRVDATRSKGSELRLVDIAGVRVVGGDRAYATYTSAIGERSHTQTVVLVREGGRLKLDGAA